MLKYLEHFVPFKFTLFYFLKSFLSEVIISVF